jgi:hypothetical protein
MKTTGGSFLLEDHQLDNVFTPEDFNEDQQMVAKLADEFAINEVLPCRRKDRAQGLGRHSRAAEESQRDGTDERRCARRVWRL